MPDEKMDVSKVLQLLNSALVLQYRSALQYTIVAGGILGFEYQFLTNQLWEYASAELLDVRRLIEKITSLGGEPTTEVSALRWDDNAPDAATALIEMEAQAIDALRAVIPHTGQEGRSEAMEHLLEHMILRKQNQVDFLTRALARKSGA